MLLLEFPVLSIAKPAEKIEDSFVQVNPLYADIISEEDVEKEVFGKKEQTSLFAGTPVYVETIEEAAEILRPQLIARKGTAVVYFRAPAYNEQDVKAVFEKATEHTGNPVEGDSLRWVHGGYDASINGYNYGTYVELAFNYNMTYYTTASQEAELDVEVDRILNSLNIDGKNDYLKIKAIYDYICANVTYDYANLNNNSHKLKFTAYAAALNKTAVCQGYALLFYRLALEEGIDTRLIAGLGGGESHGWNIVKLGDYYYNLDSTWDAGMSEYDFFLLNESNFVNHVRDYEYRTSAFHAQYPMSATDYVYNGSIDDVTGGSNIVASGYCGGEGDGTNLEWELDKDGVLTISGEGEMADYWEATPQWMEYADSMKSLVIEEGVTTVGNSAFRYCSGFTGNLVIPDSVETIGEFAFADCTGFDGNLVIGNNVTDIGREAFARCNGFRGTLTLGLRVESIGSHAFTGCDGFTEDLVIPNSVKTIGNYAFCACTGFNGDLIIGNSVTSIGGSAFRYCSGFTGNLVIPDSVETIGEFAFADCTGFDGDLVIGNNVTDIGREAFARCTGFKGTLTLGLRVESIGNNAFTGCNGFTGDIAIPNSVKTIGNYAFCACTGFDGSLYIGVNVETIGTDAFLNCYGLSGNVFLHENIKNIGDSAFIGCGTNDYYFKGNAPLVTATDFQDPSFDTYSDIICYPAGDTTWEIVDGKWNGYNVKKWYPDAFASGYCGGEGDGTNLEWILDSDGVLTISGNGMMAGYTVNGGVTTAPWRNYAANIKSLIIEEGITYIGERAFYGCFNLKGKVTLPDSVENIGYYAFSGTNIENITVSDGNDIYKSIDGVVYSKDGRTLFVCPEGKKGNLVIPDGVTNIYGAALAECDGLTGTLIIPDSVTIIGEYAFYNCSGFTGLVLGKNLENIQSSAFENCSGLTGNLIFPNKVEYIDNEAFLGCSGFDGKLVLGNNIIGIGGYAFKNCTGFTGSVVFSKDIRTIATNAFDNCGINDYYFKGDAINISPATNLNFVFNAEDTIYYPDGNSTWEIVDGKWKGYNAVKWYPDDFIASGYCGGEGDGTNLEWKLTEDGILTISGEGEMADYNRPINELGGAGVPGAEEPAPWMEYGEQIEKIVIKEGVTKIGGYAFWGLYLGGNINIPNTVKEIGAWSFCGNSFNGDLVLPEGLETVGSNAFQGAGDFDTAYIPSTLKFISGSSFRYCDLENIVIDERNQYFSCVDGVLFNKDVTEIVCFPQARTGEYVLPETVKIIGNGSFEATELYQIIVPGDIEVVEKSAFQQPPKKIIFLGRVGNISNGVTYQFSEEEATEVYFLGGMPETVVSADDDWKAFDDWTTIYYLDDGSWTFDENGLWNGYEINKIDENVVISEGYCGANYDGTHMGWVLTGDGKLDIRGSGEMAIFNWDYVEQKCSAPWYEFRHIIKSVEFDEGIISIGDYAFYACGNISGELNLPEGIEVIGQHAFESSGFSGELELPQNLKSVGTHAFQFCKFEGDLVLPEKLETIGIYAFSNCEFENVQIPASVNFIGGGAFSGTKGNINVSADNVNYSSIDGVVFTKNKKTLVCFPGGRTGSYIVPDSVETIGQSAFSVAELSEIILGKDVKNINRIAFEYYCGSIFIYSAIENIGENAFWPMEGELDVFFMSGEPSGVSKKAFNSKSGTINLYYLKGTEDKWTFDENGLWNGYTVHEWVNEKDAYLTISSGIVAVGRTRKITVDLSENSKAAAIQFSLKYDPNVLEVVSCNAGELVSGATLNYAEAGTIGFAWESINVISESGSLLEIEFRVKDDAAVQKTAIEIDDEEEFIFRRADKSIIEIGTEEGFLNIVEVIYGDIDGDGKINVLDAYEARLIAAKLETPTEEQKIAGDVDGDGKITAVDANYIRKFAVKIISVFPVEA